MDNLKTLPENYVDASIVTDIHSKILSVKGLWDETLKKQQDINNQLNQWYHDVEGLEITHISQSHKLMKRGKVILLERRRLKLQAAIYQSTWENFHQLIALTNSKINSSVCKHKNQINEIKSRAKL